VSKAQRILAAGLNRVVPNFGALQLSSSDVSRDPAVVQDYDNDPLNYRGKIPVRTLAEAIAVYDKIVPRLPDLRLPLLLVHGTEDSLAPIGGSHLVAERVGSSDLTTKYYDGLYHEVLNEPEKDQVIDDVLAWLDAHR
jgi:alpha-beta hydrolase superfamily lysophospholipase